jgi:hypothetical protein
MTARDRTVVAVILTLALAIGGWLLLIQPRRDQASKLATQVTAAQSNLSSVQGQLSQAIADKSTYARDYAELVKLGEAVPADDNVPSLLYQLQHAASSTSVDFLSLTLASSGTSAPAGTAAAAGGANLPPGVTVGPAGFPVEPFTFTFQGNFFHLSTFLGQVERFVQVTNKRIAVSGRLMTLNSINFAAGSGGFPQILATLSATTYLVPTNQTVTNGATTTGPASGQPVSAAGTTPGSSSSSSTTAGPSSSPSTPTAAVMP